MRKSMFHLACLSLLLPLVFFGCGSGSDGAAGAPGAPGTPGTPGAPGTAAASPESCSVCHVDVAGTHRATGVASATVGTPAPALDGSGNLVFNINVTVDGAPSNAFTSLSRGYVIWDNVAKATGTLPRVSSNQRDTLYARNRNDETIVDTNLVNFENPELGKYRITVPAAYLPPIASATYLFRFYSTTTTERPIVAFNLQGGAPFRDLVSDSGCASCHGPYPAWQSPTQKAEPFRHYAIGGSKCTICHSNHDRNVNIISRNADGTFANTSDNALVNGTNLVEYVHGIHNSHNMPPYGDNTVGTYYRSKTPGAENWYSIGYPSDMRSCDKCHTTADQLNAAVTAPVSRYLCFSCHQSWDGFKDHNGIKLISATSFHRTLPVGTDCMGCHGLTTSMNEAGDFHSSFGVNLAKPDAHYNQFYRGKDVSFGNPNDVRVEVTEVTKSGNNVTFKWTASKNGAAVDPCNTDLNAGPLFTYPDSTNGVAGKGGLGAYLAYAKGDDWVNDGVSTTPGQPLGARDLDTSLTTVCAANVATTTGLTISADAAAKNPAKVMLAIGGKPMDKHAETGNAYFVRVPSPTFAFTMADGTTTAAQEGAINRRQIVDNAKCTGCHAGTMYQHGGDRVDNVQMCVICHNPSSNDKNNRLDRYKIVNADGAVDTTKTYDGKTAESYDLRYLLHSIHGVEKRGASLVIYRSRGVYAFVTGDMAKPTGWPGNDNTIYGSTNGSKIGHNWTVIHYPQAVNNCEACHYPDTYEVPDQTEAAGLTVDAGTDWADQSDDIVIGPAAAACTACHNSVPVMAHATTFGYNSIVDKDEMIQLSAP